MTSAVPVSFAIDVVNGTTAPRTRVDVTVSQMGTAGLVTRTLATKPSDVPVLELAYLDELTNASPEFMPARSHPASYLYSQVVVTGGLRPLTTAAPLRIVAVASISITGVTDARRSWGRRARAAAGVVMAAARRPSGRRSRAAKEAAREAGPRRAVAGGSAASGSARRAGP